MVKRHKATIEMLDKTRRTKGAKEQMYAVMKQAAIEALICREMNILLTFPYFVRFKSGFPKGVLVEKTATTNVYKVKTKKLLDWLYEQGHSEHNSEMIMKASKDLSWKVTNITNNIMGLWEDEDVVSDNVDDCLGDVETDDE